MSQFPILRAILEQLGATFRARKKLIKEPIWRAFLKMIRLPNLACKSAEEEIGVTRATTLRLQAALFSEKDD